MRLPCHNCPWRKSTPPGGFPGGVIDAPRLLQMASGGFGPAMQCHCTPDDNRAQACVGFALAVGFDCVGLRMAAMAGHYDPEQVATDAPLHSLRSLLFTHGGLP